MAADQRVFCRRSRSSRIVEPIAPRCEDVVAPAGTLAFPGGRDQADLAMPLKCSPAPCSIEPSHLHVRNCTRNGKPPAIGVKREPHS